MNIIVSGKRKPNPAKNANPFSQLCFLYMFPIFKNTYRKEMTEDDVFEPLPEHMSSILGDRAEVIWKEEYLNPKHRKRALHRALLRLFGFRFILYGVIKGIEECFMVLLLPISIQKVVSYFQEKNISKDEVLMYSGFISFTFLLNTLTTHPSFMGLSHICMKMRVACCTLIYRKSLRLTRTSLSKTTVGQIINLLSNDVSRFDEGFVLFHFLWIAPLQTCFGLYLIYREIQVSAFFGIAFLLALFPLQIWVGNKTSTLRLQTAIRTDERVRLMNEIIVGIQVIKMYCWEKSFAKLIHHARRREMKTIRMHAYLIGLLYAFEMFITRTSIFISILSFVLFGNIISADKVFAITGIYNIIRPLITILFSISVSSVAEVHVSVTRINTFLCHDEIVKDEPLKDLGETRSKPDNDQSTYVDLQNISSGTLDKPNDDDFQEEQMRIHLDKVDAVWIADSEIKDLSNLNLNIVGNQLVAVIGPVGSGKSSLINLFLKEMTIVAGIMEIRGNISYASQEPWLFSGSIRQNILFGVEYDKDRYESIIKVCALEHDLKLFPYGDKTLVGERGKILSGGQKARINLARCIYKKADIYLLDDPLSAVDVNVGKHLYFQCIDEYLSNKICVLVTHQLQYLHTADKILIMEDGTIKQSGTFDELQSSGLDFAKLLEKAEEKETDIDVKRIRSRQLSIHNVPSVHSITQGLEDNIQFEDEEEMGHGKVKLRTYYDYFRSGGNLLEIILLISIFVFGHIIMFGGDFYVTYWVNMEQDFALSKHANDTDLPFSEKI
ncbi:hypothetical protein WA026_003521 [Henosepilachna vigintioctopunctata]|uniref:Multidrug resistance-associated protein lethal(2)03659 n=1 Tax=Henosepilachna vigintioctopunctata TaxID=420089 RepID=A0AAW1TRL3_9CUCU